MGQGLLRWSLRALGGGLLVVAVAVLAETIKPKRLAGILSAAPSVALGSLVVTVAMKGSGDARLGAVGMAVGALAFTAYCLARDDCRGAALGTLGLFAFALAAAATL